MIAHVAELVPGDFIHSFGDTHLYANHIEQADIVLARDPFASANVAQPRCERPFCIYLWRLYAGGL